MDEVGSTGGKKVLCLIVRMHAYMYPRYRYASHLLLSRYMIAPPRSTASPPPTYLAGMDSEEAGAVKSDMSSRSTKRRKVQVACLQCRDRKTRCDGVQPVCGTCERRGKAGACSYDRDELPSLQYVRVPQS